LTGPRDRAGFAPKTVAVLTCSGSANAEVYAVKCLADGEVAFARTDRQGDDSRRSGLIHVFHCGTNFDAHGVGSADQVAQSSSGCETPYFCGSPYVETICCPDSGVWIFTLKDQVQLVRAGALLSSAIGRGIVKRVHHDRACIAA
jgi:hypothetical protein